MSRSILISEKFNIAAISDRKKVIEFFFQNDKPFYLGDIYLTRIENILPSIDAVFVSMYKEKMGFLHASDIPGLGSLEKKVWPKQKMMVQIAKEPTGNKGPRVTTKISLTGRFFILTTEHENVLISRRITSSQEKARLKAIANLLKPPEGFGLVIRTEAMGATEEQLERDFCDLFLNKWKHIIDQFEIQNRPTLLLSESKDLSYRVLRDLFHDGVEKIIIDNQDSLEKIRNYLETWSTRKIPQIEYMSSKDLFLETGLLSEIKAGLSSKVELPSGGYLNIQPTEAMTVIDVNSGRFTTSNNPSETVLKTNLEASVEIARQLRLRNIGGVIVVDFIDMQSRVSEIAVLERMEEALENDPAKPQIEKLSSLGIATLTRHRQASSLHECLGEICSECSGHGVVFPLVREIEKTALSDKKTDQTETRENQEINSEEQPDKKTRENQEINSEEQPDKKTRENQEINSEFGFAPSNKKEKDNTVINFDFDQPEESDKKNIKQEKNLPGVYSIEIE